MAYVLVGIIGDGKPEEHCFIILKMAYVLAGIIGDGKTEKHCKHKLNAFLCIS